MRICANLRLKIYTQTKMLYRVAADFIFVLHFCFVLFVVFGGLPAARRRWILYLHLPALAWGVAVELLQLPCPLTRLENFLRALGGEAGYAGGFIEHLVSSIIYANISPTLQMFLGVLLIAFNLYVYSLVYKHARIFQSKKLSRN